MRRVHLLFLLAPVIWLGFGLRLHDLAAVPLRGDEAFSALNWAQKPPQQSLTEIAAIEPHPPLPYLLFHAWSRAVGGIDSPFALRFLDVLGNIIGLPAMFALGWRLSGQPAVGWLAALMWALHPFEVWHSQDFRNYAVWAGLSAAALWLGLRLIDLRRRADWRLYAVAASLSALMFYTELFMIVALALAAIAFGRPNRRFALRFLALQALIAAAALLAFLVLQGDLLTAGGYGGNLDPFYPPDYLTRLLPALILADAMPPDSPLAWLFLCLAAALFAFAVAAKSRRQIGFIAAWAVTPLFLLGLVSLRINIFHPRYVLAAAPAFILLFSLGGFHLADIIHKIVPLSRRLLMLCLLLPWLVLAAAALANHFNNPTFRKSPAWDELGDFLNDRVNENDLVIQLSKDAAFGYYYDGAAQDIALPASPRQPASEIAAALSAAQSEYDSIYVVANAIPAWQNADAVENWMNANMQAALRSSASGLAIRQYKNWAVAADPAAPPLVQFEAAAALLGYDFFTKPLPTGELLLWLYWRPLSPTAQPLKSFVHVVGAVNPATGSILWSQDDQFPQQGRLDSTAWSAAEVYRDVYYLPTDSLAAGGYRLKVGWYEPVSGARLLTAAGEDMFELVSFTYP